MQKSDYRFKVGIMKKLKCRNLQSFVYTWVLLKQGNLQHVTVITSGFGVRSEISQLGLVEIRGNL